MSTTLQSPLSQPILPNPSVLTQPQTPQPSGLLFPTITQTQTQTQTQATTTTTASPHHHHHLTPSEWYHDYHEEIHDLLAGTVGGVSGLIVGAPFDLVKMRLQSGLAGSATPLAAAGQILRAEGPGAFFKGLLPPIIANVPINAIGFATYGNAQRNLNNMLSGPGGRNVIPQTPMKYQSDFYTNELFTRYTLPAHFANAVKPAVGATVAATTTDPKFAKFQKEYTTQTTLAANSSAPNWAAVFLAGCWSGLLQCFVLSPSELLKIQEQSCIGKAPSSLQLAKEIVSKHGFMSLYRGFFATVLREAPSIGAYFLTYEWVKWKLRQEKFSPQVMVDGKVITPDESEQLFGTNGTYKTVTSSIVNSTTGVAEKKIFPDIKINWQHDIEYSFWVPLIGGSLAGPASWISTYPVDVVKTRLQAMSHDEYKKSSVWKCFRDVYREKGAKFFTTGLGTTIVRAIPVNAVTFLFYEKALELCKENQFLMPPARV